MRLACLFSGGKDSVYALHLAKYAGHEISCLVAMRPQNTESFLFHVPNIDWTKLQAESMGFPLLIVQTSGQKSQEMKDLKRVLSELKQKNKIEGVVTGAVFSTYQASRIQKICFELGLFCYNPLWQTSPASHWHELLVNGFEVILTSVAAQGLDNEWLGKKMDENAVHVLRSLEKKHGLSSIGEGGEFESFVVNAPLFAKKIYISNYHDEWKGLQGTRHILRAQLVDEHLRKKINPSQKASVKKIRVKPKKLVKKKRVKAKRAKHGRNSR
ncbi:MAG: diphthine--ammonia ligase [Candidatus Diapherotrites archaeon]|uniref:Diphthine--ammonia ligase n=1 Tax=Candidatus Iainarchaeum sp. TaxID=3101447 RepID=A0A8T4C706_9ARCH|nr:diphthine--ammonia ligase [Candidatus Diapherotrites archaeon]